MRFRNIPILGPIEQLYGYTSYSEKQLATLGGDRRSVIKGLGIIIASLLACRTSDLIPVQPAETHRYGIDANSNYETLASYFAGRYNLIISTYGIDYNHHEINTKYTGRVVSSEELLEGMRLLVNQLAKYPPDFFRNNGIKAVSFWGDIKDQEGNQILGLSSPEIPVISVTTTPDGIKEIVSFDHEVFHQAKRHDGTPYTNDPEWLLLSASRDLDCDLYEDSSDGRTEGPLCPDSYYLDSPQSKDNTFEDAANTAEVLLNPERHRQELLRIQSLDPDSRQILLAKINKIKRYYYKWSKGLINDSYWSDLINNKVGIDYFP